MKKLRATFFMMVHPAAATDEYYFGDVLFLGCGTGQA
jgi:hypothetical protein